LPRWDLVFVLSFYFCNGEVGELMNGHDRASLWPVVVRSLLAAILFLALTRIGVAAQDTALQLDPQHTTINFTLGDVLHTVHGTFQLKQGALRLSAPSGKLTGKIVVDARSGDGGGAMRDRKMQKEVLQSHRYPDIVFRADRVDGDVTPQEK
jgi:polyisoprenoid-binding protein YceI